MDSKTQEPLVVGRQLEAGGEYEDDERVVFRARFDDRYVRYQLVSFSLVCVLTVFFIPFLLCACWCCCRTWLRARGCSRPFVTVLPFLYIAIRANFQSRVRCRVCTRACGCVLIVWCWGAATERVWCAYVHCAVHRRNSLSQKRLWCTSKASSDAAASAGTSRRSTCLLRR